MVVDHYHVEVKICLLRKSAVDSVADSAHAVTHRNDYRCLHGEFALAEVYRLEFRFEIAAHSLEVFGAGLFHFNLYAAVLGVDIVEDFFARPAVVDSDVAIEILVDVYYWSHAAYVQTKIVEAGGLVVGLQFSGGEAQHRRVEQYHGAEVEIVAQRAILIVDCGGVCALAVGFGHIVGIEHACAGVGRYAQHALKGQIAEVEPVGLVVQQSVVGSGGACDSAHCG